MRRRADVAARVAARYSSRFLQGYVRSKVRTDPVYAAVLERLRGHPHALVDVGCGAGVLTLFLREHGFEPPITGIDFDERKIAAARRACEGVANADFAITDARHALPPNRSVVMLDLLHYFTEDEQQVILANAARVVPPGGMVIIRDAVRDRSWRYRMTYAQESFSRLISWLRAERLHFPRRETIVDAFPGFVAEVVPLWGRTPFNNYLFVFRRPSSGITNA